MKKITLITIALMFVFTISEAQEIPNAGFENWTNIGAYSNPDGWDQLNALTANANVFTCEKGTPANVGSYYLKLTSRTVTGMGVIPGIAVSGQIDPSTFQPKSGFPFTGQPQSLTGKWQHMIYGSSQGFIDVNLTRWDNATNSRIIVANGHVDLTGMAMSWANFSIPLNYNETNTPDSCVIIMSASGTAPTNNDYLWVDAMTFQGSVTSINPMELENTFEIYPNPVLNNLIFNAANFDKKIVSLKIMDMMGSEIKAFQIGKEKSIETIDVSSLSKGNYILFISTNNGFSTKKFIKE